MQKLNSGVNVEFFDVLDSTSSEARRRASTSLPSDRYWIIAAQQNAGYGRRARQWSSGEGDFAATLSFAPKAPKHVLGQISFIAALCVRDAIAPLLNSPVAVKWPNDILVDRAKIAGLLLEHCEYTRDGKTETRLLVGIGINIVSNPEGTPYPATRLSAHLETPPTALDLLARIDEGFWSIYAAWERQGFAGVRQEWLSHAAGLGAPISVVLPNETTDGIFETIDENGGLVLRKGDGTRIINAGDVFFERPKASH